MRIVCPTSAAALMLALATDTDARCLAGCSAALDQPCRFRAPNHCHSTVALQQVRDRFAPTPPVASPSRSSRECVRVGVVVAGDERRTQQRSGSRRDAVGTG